MKQTLRQLNVSLISCKLTTHFHLENTFLSSNHVNKGLKTSRNLTTFSSFFPTTNKSYAATANRKNSNDLQSLFAFSDNVNSKCNKNAIWNSCRDFSAAAAAATPEPVETVTSSPGEKGGKGTKTRSFTPSAKVTEIVNEITHLSLLEVSELVQQLKVQLNLPDTPTGMSMGMPMMPMGMGMGMPMGATGGAAGVATAEGSEPEEKEKAVEKPVVSVQLDGFDEKSKIKVIKEVKTISGLGLKEAKTLVESAPQVVKADVKRADAMEMMKTLVEAGAKISLI